MAVTELMLGSERPRIGQDEEVRQLTQPVMLDRLAALDVIGVDAAVAAGTAGDRARRLLENRRRMAPDRLPTVLITVHAAEEHQQAQAAAERFKPLAQEVQILTQRGRNETAVHALQVHRARWPETSEQSRSSHRCLGCADSVQLDLCLP